MDAPVDGERRVPVRRGLLRLQQQRERGSREKTAAYWLSFIGRIQILRKRTGLPWSCSAIGPIALDGA
jgi:hypothetical protein